MTVNTEMSPYDLLQRRKRLKTHQNKQKLSLSSIQMVK